MLRTSHGGSPPAGLSTPQPVRATTGELLHRHRYALLLGAIVLVSLVFRLYVSSECSLGLDEIVSTRRESARPWARVLRGAAREYPPLVFIFTKLSIELVGPSVLGVRAASLLFGCVLLVAVYRLCLELALGEVRALFVVGSLSVTPFFIRHAVEGRHYAIMMALTTFAAVYALRLARDPSSFASLAGFAVSGALASTTHYFALPYVIALAGVVALDALPSFWRLDVSTGRRVAIAFTLGALTLVLARVGWGALSLKRYYAGEEQAGMGIDFALFPATLQAFSLFQASPLGVALELVLALAGVLLLALRLRGVARVVPLALAFVPCLLAPLVSTSHFVAARYIAPSLVFYHLSACVALFALSTRVLTACTGVARLSRFSRALALAVVAAPLGLRLLEYPAGYAAGDDYYAGLRAYFRAQLARDTLLVTYVGSFGERVMNIEYPVEPKPQQLEKFRPVAGIERYLVAEFLVDDSPRRAELEALIERHFGLSPADWRALPRVPLPASALQPAVTARLVELRQR